MTSSAATAALASTTSYQPTSSLTSNTSTSDVNDTSTASQDRFLKLLVAQLNNQDPMNPMDNAQMTTQIAQINTVTGIQTLNTTVSNLATQMAAMQGIQASTLIGHSVLTTGDTVSIDSSTQNGSGLFTLDSAATDVQVKVSTAGGTVLGTLKMGAMEAGQHDFNFDATGYTSADGLKFTVTATGAGGDVTSTGLVKGTVTSIGSDSTGALTLKFADGTSSPYTSVKSIL